MEMETVVPVLRTILHKKACTPLLAAELRVNPRSIYLIQPPVHQSTSPPRKKHSYFSMRASAAVRTRRLDMLLASTENVFS